MIGTDREIDDRYTVALAAWQDARGLGAYDLTPAQFGRLRAVEKALGDMQTAARLLFMKWAYWNGKVRL